MGVVPVGYVGVEVGWVHGVNIGVADPGCVVPVG